MKKAKPTLLVIAWNHFHYFKHKCETTVRCIFVYVYFPHLLGGFLHILTCTCNYMLWPLALREYNLSIPNMVSEQ
jgi:hypothetical protein